MAAIYALVNSLSGPDSYLAFNIGSAIWALAYATANKKRDLIACWCGVNTLVFLGRFDIMVVPRNWRYTTTSPNMPLTPFIMGLLLIFGINSIFIFSERKI